MKYTKMFVMLALVVFSSCIPARWSVENNQAGGDPFLASAAKVTDLSAAGRLPDGRTLFVSNKQRLYTLPAGKSINSDNIDTKMGLVTIEVPHDPEGACVDTIGNVWVLGSSGVVERYSRNIDFLPNSPKSRTFSNPLGLPFNFEGMAYQAKSTGSRYLLIGGRSPLVNNKAVIFAIEEPAKWLFGSNVSTIETYYVNLNGLGIRDLAALPDGRVLVIAGGTTDGKPTPHLRLLDQNMQLVPGYDKTLKKGVHWEAILIADKVYLIADGDGPPTQVCSFSLP